MRLPSIFSPGRENSLRSDPRAPGPAGRGPGTGRLLVVGDADTERCVRAMFPGGEVVAVLRETGLTEYMTDVLKPDVVVVGARIKPRGETTDQWVARLRVSFPGLQVVTVGPEQGWTAGVGGETERPEPRVIGQETIVVWSPKGGVGKTFVVVNLACASAIATGGNTCLADLDLQSGDVACYLDLLDGPSIIDLLSNLSEMRPDTVDRYVEVHPPTGLRVLAAPRRPELSDLVKPEHIREALSLARRRWGLVFVDTPPDVTSEIVGESIEQSSRLVLVVTQDVAALRQAKIALDILTRAGFNRKESLYVVVNRVSQQSLFPVSRIEEYLETRVAGTIPEDRKAVEKAGMDGKPVVMYPQTGVAEAFWNILNQVIPGVGAVFPWQAGKKKRRFGLW